MSGFFEPLFYLLSIGLGIGALVGSVAINGQEIPYTAFVAPALLASSAMNGAIYDSTFNVFFKLKYAKTYDAILSTPVGVGDVALGEIPTLVQLFAISMLVADAVARSASAAVWVIRGPEQVDASSIMELLTLACEKGTTLTFTAADPADRHILDALVQLVESGFEE